jgi:hypothetical protein
MIWREKRGRSSYMKYEKKSLTWLIWLWVGLAATGIISSMAWADASDLSELKEKRDEARDEINTNSETFKKNKKRISDIKAGKLESEFKGECHRSCLPESKRCSEADVDAVGLALGDLGQSACVVIYRANPKLDLVTSPACKKAIENCGEIAKDKEITKLTEENKTLNEEIKLAEKRLKSVKEDISEINGCAYCKAMMGGSFAFGGPQVAANLFADDDDKSNSRISGGLNLWANGSMGLNPYNPWMGMGVYANGGTGWNGNGIGWNPYLMAQLQMNPSYRVPGIYPGVYPGIPGVSDCWPSSPWFNANAGWNPYLSSVYGPGNIYGPGVNMSPFTPGFNPLASNPMASIYSNPYGYNPYLFNPYQMGGVGLAQNPYAQNPYFSSGYPGTWGNGIYGNGANNQQYLMYQQQMQAMQQQRFQQAQQDMMVAQQQAYEAQFRLQQSMSMYGQQGMYGYGMPWGGYGGYGLGGGGLGFSGGLSAGLGVGVGGLGLGFGIGVGL